MESNLSQPYLKTKLQPPAMRQHQLPRPALSARLAEILRMPLTLVCAPPGYGKTTTLVEWVRNAVVPVAWLTLDDSENDAVRFFHSLVLAVQIIYPDLGKSAQAALNYPADDMLGVASRLFVNDLVDLRSALVLVLDDYHIIHNQEAHNILAYLLEHHPPNLHLVIASREEPPINLARRRARGAVLEIRAVDLRFRKAEIAAFMNEVIGFTPSEQVLGALEEQTEGWAAAVQLAGLSLRSGEEEIPSGALLAGQHYIFEYLAQEVLDRQPPALQRFLLASSVVERVCGPLCDALVESFLPEKDGAACLDALMHANLFVHALDNEHRWYRYHALFADYLRQSLRMKHAAWELQLQRQAAEWFAAKGLVEEACKHALAAQDYEALARYLERYVEQLEKNGELTTIATWLQRVPEALFPHHPRLNLSRAWVSFASIDLVQAGSYLDMAESSPQLQTDSMLRAGVLTARALFFGLAGNYRQAQRYGAEADRTIPEKNHYLYSMLKFNLSFPYFMNNEMDRAVQELETAIQSALKCNTPLVALLSLRVLGEAHIHLGHLTLAEQTFLRAGEIVDECMGENSPLKGISWMGLGEVYRQRNQMERAQALLEAGVSECLTFMPVIAVDGLIWLSELKHGRGDRAGAQAALRRVVEIGNIHSHRLLDEWWSRVMLLRLNIQQGYLDEVERWLKASGVDLKDPLNQPLISADMPLYIQDASQYIIARFLLANGRSRQSAAQIHLARGILERVVPVSEAHGLYSLVLEGLVLLVQALISLEEPEQAQTRLLQALRIGAQERPLRVFLDEREALMDTLSAWRQLPMPPAERKYFDEILAAWQAEKTTPAVEVIQQKGLVEPLSRREMEVLRWLAAGKSNKEIAAGLVLSLNTVKRHTAAVMGKLSAKNRTEAVHIGKEQGII